MIPVSSEASRRFVLDKKIVVMGLLWVLAVGLVLVLVGNIVSQFSRPTPSHRLVLDRDIPLPGAMPDVYRTAKNPLANGVSLLFDHFDFQALDPQTHLLFIAHTGPSPDREQQINPKFNPDKDAKTDGNIVVFDTLQKKVVSLLPIPQVAGMVVAPDLHKVYAAAVNANQIIAIDETTLKYEAIDLQDNDGPDALEYDAVDHLLFVSNPGVPPNPDKSNIIDRKNQNVTIIDTNKDEVVAAVPLGVDGKWGDDVGHVRYDSGLHKAYVAVQQLPDPDDPKPNLLPPPGTAYLAEIDPLAHSVVTRLKLPDNCLTPHGVAVDSDQHIAFVACVDEDPPSMHRVDLQAMQVIQESAWIIPVKPDMIAIDHTQHIVYVACGAGIALFQENGHALRWLANYTFGVNTHSLTINEQTREIYIPIARVGGRPILRIMKYDPKGAL